MKKIKKTDFRLKRLENIKGKNEVLLNIFTTTNKANKAPKNKIIKTKILFIIHNIVS